MRYYVDKIEDATRAYDTNTEQYVYLEVRIPDTGFFIAQSYESEEYLIVKEDELTELHFC